MNLEPIIEAAKVVPVFMRNEQTDTLPLDLGSGCYSCAHNNLLRYDHRFTTVVAYGIDEDTGEWEAPLFGLTFSHNDGSYQELRPRHWLRGSIQGRTGFYGAWTAAEAIYDEPIMFVRLLNRFTGIGVEHRHTRIDFGAYLAAQEYHDEIYLKIWEPHYTRVGIYVEPVAELLNGEFWGAEDINKYTYAAYRNTERQSTLVHYYWKNLNTARLTQIKAGGNQEQMIRRFHGEPLDAIPPGYQDVLNQELERAMEMININAARNEI